MSSIIDIDTEASIEGFKDGIIVSDKLLSVSRVNVQSVSEKIENVDAKIEEFINQSFLWKNWICQLYFTLFRGENNKNILLKPFGFKGYSILQTTSMFKIIFY